MKNLAGKLKAWRVSNNMSQEEFARLLHYSTRAEQTWECGQQLPAAEALISISKVMGVSVDLLLGNTENPNINL